MASNIEDILKKELHIIHVEGAESWVFQEIDFSYFKEELRFVERAILNVQSFLCAPYVVDDFKDHAQRRVWQTQMREKYGLPMREYFLQNSLRLNVLSGLVSSINLLNAVYTGPNVSEFSGKASEITNFAEVLREYDSLSNEDKYGLVKLLKINSYSILNFLKKN